MNFVLDSSVALKWFLPEADSERAARLRDAYVARVHELSVPDLFCTEVAHALAKAERRGIIRPPSGSDNLADLLAALPPVHDSIPLLPRAFEIASAVRIGVYDCVYVALAEREQCRLITADERLTRTLRDDFPFINLLGELAL
ncbi:MAG: type II toxin-antitoxin system VapC family toxin [Planctomycetaceae bacterium]|nr:type II toxin-antitoxin system VapC family toxin [Planctomycetaceae bacterium]